MRTTVSYLINHSPRTVLQIPVMESREEEEAEEHKVVWGWRYPIKIRSEQ